MSAPEGGQVRIGDRYRIEACIGVGAMGVVWRATDELLGRTVAVKELLALASGTSDPDIEQSRQRILREGRIGARLHHAHVISMFDAVIHEDRPWLIMEYLPSESLAALIKLYGPLSAAQTADIGRQMADGLAAAHLAGVVHRDVKPGNVLVAPNGLVKLTDFGVSRAVDEVQLTRTGLIAGTPAYLAPEVAQGREPTAASDVFALGATLYAAVEGVPPFGLDDNAYALLHKVATGEPEPPRQAGPLAGVLMRLLSVDPHTRPSAAQARDLLATVAADPVDVDAAGVEVLPTKDAPSKAAAPRQAPVDRPGPRRRVPALLGLLIGVLVLMGGTGIAALTTGSGGAAAAPPTTHALTATPTPTAVPPAAMPSRLSPAPASSPPPRLPPRLPPRPAAAAPPAAAPAATPASGTEPVTFVQHYYALLPGNTDAAFALLGPQARNQAGGAAGFTSFYARMQSVTVQNPRRTGTDTVTATVRFVHKNGNTTNEPYQFVMTTNSSGTMIMDSFSRG